MNIRYISIGGLLVLIAISWTSCTYNNIEPIGSPYQVTQDELNAAVLVSSSQDTTILGDPFNAFSDTLTRLHKLRDLFDNILPEESVKVGTIMTRRAYYYPYTNKRDSLLNVVVMVKREPGYYPEGGDWEYMDIAYDKTTDYNINPNGMLVLSDNSITRGKITKCANCHTKASGNDFLFHR